MLRYVTTALDAEGPTDYRFLSSLMRRLVEQHCLDGATSQVEVGEVVGLDKRAADRAEARTPRYRDAFDLIFVHRDGAGDPPRAIREHVEPQRRALAAAGSPAQIVGVIPVREMEAWALADGDALRRVLGTTLTNTGLGLPSTIPQLERVTDPKRLLVDVVAKVVGDRKAHSQAPSYLGLLADEIDLASIRLLPAFARCDAEVGDALRRIGVVRT